MLKLNRGYSQSRVKHMKVILSSVFNLALDDEVISVNPALNLGKQIFKKKALKPKEVDVLPVGNFLHYSILLKTISLNIILLPLLSPKRACASERFSL